MKLCKNITFLLFIINSFNLNFAQNSNVKFQHFSVDDGLSQNSVTSILQDYKGFLWFGTYGGLSRYDGNQFKNFYHSTKDTNSIANNAIKVLFEDSKKNLWVGCYTGGLNKYNREKENFTHFPNPFSTEELNQLENLTSICEDSSGILWIGTNSGLTSFDPIKEKFLFVDYSFVKEPFNPSKRFVFNTFIDNDENLVFGTSSKFGVYNSKENVFESVLSDIPSYVITSYQKVDGNYMLGTYKNGVIECNKKMGIVNKFLKETNILSLYEDVNENVWIGTFGKGLNYIAKNSNYTKKYEYNSIDPNSLSNNIIYALYKDNTDVLWIGTDLGVNRLNLGQKKFKHVVHKGEAKNSIGSSIITSIAKDIDGNFWISYWGDGIDKLDTEFNVIDRYRYNSEDSSSLSDNLIRQIIVDKNNNVWAVTNGNGISIFNQKTKKFINYSEQNSNNYFPNNFTICIYEDNSGVVWVGGWTKGLIKCELDNNYKLKTEVFSNRKNDSTSISSNIVTSMLEDSEQNFWIATKGGGLNKFVGYDNTNIKPIFEHYRKNLNNDNLLALDELTIIYEDKQKNIWIGTNGAGLQKFNKTDKTFETFTTDDGLISNTISGIVDDEDGNIWVSTISGISKLDLSNKQIYSFDENDGMPNHDFHPNSFFKESNKFYFGTARAIIYFDPNEIVLTSIAPKVAITNLKIFNKEVKIGEKINGNVILEKSILETDQIKLSYKESIILFEFAALHFASPDKNLFAYRMNGFEKDWRTVSAGRQFAEYTNLDPGEYSFEVKAANNDGLWNQKAALLKIIITPPFWATWWFRALSLIFAFSGIVVFHKYRTSTIRKRSKELELRVRERTSKLESANKALHDFSYIVSHDLKAPLRGISQLSEWITTDYNDKLDEDGKGYLEMLIQRVAKMNSLIEGILRYSRASKEVKKKELVDLNSSVIEVVEFLAFPSNVRVNIQSNLPKIFAEKLKIEQVFQNIIGNAVEHNDKDICIIDIYGESTAKYWKICVKDNGPGIEKKYQDRVFGIFQTLSDKENSTGIGLSIVRKIVEMLNGQVEIESPNDSSNCGATFILIFPKTGK